MKPLLIINTYGGLCNQRSDIAASVAFALINKLNFCFQYCSFRNLDNKSWRNTDFSQIFDETPFKKLDGYKNFQEIKFSINESIWNKDLIPIAKLIKSDQELINIIHEYKYINLIQFSAIFNWQKYHKYTNYDFIQPIFKITSLYSKISGNFNYKKFNSIHYRYEDDFTTFFRNQDPSIRFPFLEKILDSQIFKDNSLPIFIATTNIDGLGYPHINGKISDYSNLIFTNESYFSLNYEQFAYIDFLICCSSLEFYGHSSSSFSHQINDFKLTSNYYDF